MLSDSKVPSCSMFQTTTPHAWRASACDGTGKIEGRGMCDPRGWRQAPIPCPGSGRLANRAWCELFAGMPFHGREVLLWKKLSLTSKGMFSLQLILEVILLAGEGRNNVIPSSWLMRETRHPQSPQSPKWWSRGAGTAEQSAYAGCSGGAVMWWEHIAKTWGVPENARVEKHTFSENSTRVPYTGDTQWEVVLMRAVPPGERKDVTGESEKGLYKAAPS